MVFCKSSLPEALSSDNALRLVSYETFCRQESERAGETVTPGFLLLCQDPYASIAGTYLTLSHFPSLCLTSSRKVPGEDEPGEFGLWYNGGAAR